MSTRVRFSPSARGRLSIGDAHAAVYNWLYARHEGGVFVLRLDDVHPTSEEVCADLRWLGLDWDEGPFIRSERLPLYRRLAEQLVEMGRAYRCYCAPQRCQGRCRDLSADERAALEARGIPSATRFCAPRTDRTRFDDLICHSQVVENNALNDVVLLRPDGSPTHHLTDVLDDHEMAIAHVIQSHHKLSDTFVHLALYAALGWDPPQYAHLPSVAWPEDGATASLAVYRERGYLALPVANQLARLGWSPRGKRALLALGELAERFELGRVSHRTIAFDLEQLGWLNRRYLAQLDEATVTRLFIPYWHSAYGLADRAQGTGMTSGAWQRALALSVRGEVHALAEVVDRVRFAFLDGIEPDVDAAQMLAQPYAPEVLSAFMEGISAVEPFDFDSIDAYVSDLRRRFKASHGVRSRDVMYVVRAALTGELGGPCLVDACRLLGRRRCVERAREALAAYQHA
jgi:glutamyl-tRNA synthetase